MSSDSRDSMEKPCLKRVLGHVEDEALRKLNKCLIGSMATVCSTSQVEDRLHCVTVKYMGGCKFLIDIMDQELFSQLQVQEWAILKEVLSEVESWTDLFHLPERITWIQSVAPNHSQAKKNVEFSSESSSDSSSDSVQSTAPTNKTHFNCNGEDEVAKAICSEKVSLVDVSSGDLWERKTYSGIYNLMSCCRIIKWKKHFPRRSPMKRFTVNLTWLPRLIGPLLNLVALRNISRQGRVAVPHIAKKRKQNQQRITCQDRKEWRMVLEKKCADDDVSEEDQKQLTEVLGGKGN
ncbi:hypothetical protein V6N12_048346 [Hibiscus sabdariffa]|uniref:Uncharacterized protein n=1 Tax=Hibiscus sabdariffa TaxID=183260 RepID=A0ABR2EJD4_9ROSI